MSGMTFPASRGLSRRGKLKREERDLCRLPTSCLMKPPTKFLVETYRFSKPVSFNVLCACLVRLNADNYRAHGRYGFCEFRNFSIPAIKSSVSTLGDKRIKEITSLARKSILGFLKGRNKCVSPDGLRQIFNLPPQQYEWPPSYLLFTVTRIASLQNQ